MRLRRSRKAGRFDAAQEAELEELQERIEEVSELQNPATKYATQKRNQMERRTAKSIQEENRLTQRALGAGAPEKVDTITEKFNAKCLEAKVLIQVINGDTLDYSFCAVILVHNY